MPSAPANINTFVRYAIQFLRWARGDAELRMTGTQALAQDARLDGARQAMRFTMPLVDTAEDALGYLLRDYGLPTYRELYGATLERIRQAWATHEIAGAEAMLIAQAEACGFLDVSIARDVDSSFWIEASNVDPDVPTYSASLFYGTFTWGYQALNPDHIESLRAMIRYFRPARELYRGLRRTGQPDTFAGLRLWLDADSEYVTLSGSAVTSWLDRQEARTFDQATGGLRPTYVASHAALNNLPVLTFASDTLLDPNGGGSDISIQTTPGGAIFIVLDQNAGASQVLLRATDRVLASNAASNVAIHDGTAERADGALVTGPQLLSLIFDSGVQVRRDGVNVGAPLVWDSLLFDAGARLRIGAFDTTPTLPFSGAIAEILIYDEGLTAGEIDAIERYLMTKYAL